MTYVQNIYKIKCNFFLANIQFNNFIMDAVITGLQLKNLKIIYDKTNDILHPDNIIKDDELANKKGKSNHVFKPGVTFEKQVARFRNKVDKNKWNERVAFLGFKGSFKVEYWNYFEFILRSLTALSKITFIDTKIDGEHLQTLRSLLQWIFPKSIKIKFKQNELDDEDFESFLIEGILQGGINLRKIEIISNPGIYKGQFLTNLKRFIKEKQKVDRNHYYYLIKNKEYSSLGLLIAPVTWNDTYLQEQLAKLKKNIAHTYYYKINLNSCLNDKNQKTFYHFINQTYHQDKLEQLEYLDISNCKVGLPSTFEKLCSQIASSKGLLYLGIQNQPLLTDTDCLQKLMGDRYNQLRINEIDWGKNQHFVEKCVKVLYENCVARSAKKMQFKDSMNQHLPVIVKFLYMSESYEKEIKKLKQKQKKSKQTSILTLNLQELDLSYLENYNRHDLVEQFLLATVFNEHSRLKKFQLHNQDIGRVKAYLAALTQFEKYVHDNKFRLKQFKPLLHHIGLQKQTYRMLPELFKEELLRLFFTKQQDLYQITSILFQNCFTVGTREDGLKLALQEIQNTNFLYTLKKIAFKDARIYDNWASVFENIVFSKKFQLEEIVISEGDFLEADMENIMSLGETYLPKSLRHFELRTIYLARTSLYRLINLLVFNKEVQLKTLILVDFEAVNEEYYEEAKQKFEEMKDYQFTYDTLELGKLQNSNLEQELQNMLVHKNIKKVTFGSMKINVEIERKPTKLDYFHLNDCKDIKWEQVADIYIFPCSLQSLELSNMDLGSWIIEGFNKSIEKIHMNLEEHQLSRICFHMKDLILNSCKFEGEIFSIFFSSVHTQLEKLHIIKCSNFDSAIETMKKTYEIHVELKEFLTISISDLNLEGTTCKDDNFDWFFENICLAKTRQKLAKINLKDCQLNDNKLNALNRILNDLKKFQQDNSIRKYFQIRELNLTNNSEISFQKWKKFFNHLYNIYDIVEEEEDEEQLQQDEAVEIAEDELDLEEEEDQEQQKLMDEINQKTDEIRDLIISEKLSLPKKIYAQPGKYKIEAPKIQKLELNLKFAEDSADIRKSIYSNIVHGMIFFPNSQLSEIVLSNIYTPYFVEYSQKALKQAKNYSLTILRKIYKNPIKIIKFKNFIDENEDNLKLFIELYFTEELQVFQIEEINQGNIYSYIESEIGDKEWKLKELCLNEVLSSLDPEQTQNFVENLVFNPKVPLEKLKIGKRSTLRGFEFDSEKNNKSKLKDFQGIFSNEETAELFKSLLPSLLKSLQKLSINSTTNTKFLEQIDIESIKTPLNEIVIEYAFPLNRENLVFLYKLRPQLKYLQIQKLNYENFDKSFFEEYKEEYFEKKKPNQDCKLLITVTQNEDILEDFVFGQAFKFNSVKLDKGLEAFQLLKLQQVLQGGLEVRYLKKLELSYNLFYNSGQQLNEQSLELIGRQLIFNESSVLEWLHLHQCHLKIPGIKALVAGAEELRTKIKERGDEGKATLSLRKFTMYYSLYVEDEGAKLLSDNIWFNEYIRIEHFSLQVLNWNNQMQLDFNAAAKRWLEFQKTWNTPWQGYLNIQHADFGRNEFVSTEEAWNDLCDTFIFTDLTPKMEILHIHFMAMKDEQIEYFCKKADTFFGSKSSNYKYPVKRLNYMLNTAPTFRGWRRISEAFFFQKNCYFEELNLQSTMLDEDEKLSAIFEPALKRAKLSKNKKLPLHSFLCYNVSLKAIFADILSPRPHNYQDQEDLPVKISPSYSTGLIDGVPQSFGQLTQLTSKVLYNEEEFINTSQWTKEVNVRYGQFHMSFVDGFLIPAGEIVGRENGSISIDSKALDQLMTFFKYVQISPGDPYPIRAFFNPEAYKFYGSKNSKIRVLNFIPTQIANLELVGQNQIIEIWQNVRASNTSIDQIQLEYTMNDDLVEKMFEMGYNEEDIIQLIRIIPPSSITVKNSLTLNAIKAIYSIFWDHYQFNYADFLYDQHNALNVGIGFAWREHVYNSIVSNSMVKTFKIIQYYFLSLFVGKVEPYKFSDQVKDLNQYLSTQTGFFLLLFFITFIYYIICLFAGYVWTQMIYPSDDFNIICTNGLHPYADYTYYAFAFVSFLIEGYLSGKIATIIPDHLKSVIKADDEEEEEDEDEEEQNKEEQEGNEKNQGNQDQDEQKNQKDPNKVYPENNDEEEKELIIENQQEKKDEEKAKENQNNEEQEKEDKTKALMKKLNSTKKLTKKMTQNLKKFASSNTVKNLKYAIDVIAGQLEKFDFFNDVRFVLTAYFCNQMIVAYCAFGVVMFTVLRQVYNFFRLILRRCFASNTRAKILSTNYINDFYTISVIGRNMALATTLDSVAPFNVTSIPNNALMRYLLPGFAGRSMSNFVKGYVAKFAFQKVPMILLQVYFIVVKATQTSDKIDIGIYIAVANSGLALLIAFIKFMSIRPSVIFQADFDALAEKKKEVYYETQLKYVEESRQLIEKLSEFDEAANRH